MYIRKFKRSIWDKHRPQLLSRYFPNESKKRHESLLQSHKGFYLRTSCNTLKAYCYFISEAFTMFFEEIFLSVTWLPEDHLWPTDSLTYQCTKNEVFYFGFLQQT